jgi:hypothetical protein
LEDNNPSFFSEDVLLPYDIEKRTKFLLFWLQEKKLLFIDEEVEKKELFRLEMQEEKTNGLKR